jgi:pimeloyl-ACP methyl ester carboxylesterase
LLAKVNAKWMREFLAYNPADDFPQITVPVLAITGSKDIQVDPDDLPAMKDIVTSPFEYHILPDVSHLLRLEKGEASISSYKKMVQQPLDNRIPEIILTWLDARIQG